MPENLPPAQKKLTLQDAADKFLEIETQIVNLRKTIVGLEQAKSELFLMVCHKVDELSGPKNRGERRAEARKQKKTNK